MHRVIYFTECNTRYLLGVRQNQWLVLQMLVNSHPGSLGLFLKKFKRRIEKLLMLFTLSHGPSSIVAHAMSMRTSHLCHEELTQVM